MRGAVVVAECNERPYFETGTLMSIGVDLVLDDGRVLARDHKYTFFEENALDSVLEAGKRIVGEGKHVLETLRMHNARVQIA